MAAESEGMSPLSDIDQDIDMNEFNDLHIGKDNPPISPCDILSVKKDKMFTGITNTENVEGKNCPHQLIRKINGDCVTESNTNHLNIIDEEETLILLYQQKIRKLMKQQLETDNLAEVSHIRELINELKSTISQLKNFGKKDQDQRNMISRNSTKKIDIPYFQLVDDPITSKSENRPSYDNAEMFVSTFEMILETNDVDINRYWKKYLPKAFLFSKNEKHHRWYTNFINPININFIT